MTYLSKGMLLLYVQKAIELEMEPVGELTVARSKYLNTMYVYNCVRQPGYVYEFYNLRGNKFRCKSCKKLNKSRCITIDNGVLVPGRKHPEDDHHPDCRPLPETANTLLLYVYRVGPKK